jgi:hypothetical protein
VLLRGVPPGSALRAWQAARAAVPRTGRWPVLIIDDEYVQEPSAQRLAELGHAAHTADPWQVFRQYADGDPVSAAEAEAALNFFGLGLAARAAEVFTFPVAWPVLDRWVYRQLLADPALAARAFEGYDGLIGTQVWHQWGEDTQLLLIPSPSMWLVPAWVSYYGALTPAREGALCAALRQWHHRWGAELVSCWGTMLEFTASTRPAFGDQAWELAGQLLAVGGSVQLQQRQLAMALPFTRAWFLHDRP